MCVCVKKIFVKDFSRTTGLRILKSGMSIGYILLYCFICISFLIFIHFSFSPETPVDGLIGTGWGYTRLWSLCLVTLAKALNMFILFFFHFSPKICCRYPLEVPL